MKFLNFSQFMYVLGVGVGSFLLDGRPWWSKLLSIAIAIVLLIVLNNLFGRYDD